MASARDRDLVIKPEALELGDRPPPLELGELPRLPIVSRRERCGWASLLLPVLEA
jgi:hypothetical protein